MTTNVSAAPSASAAFSSLVCVPPTPYLTLFKVFESVVYVLSVICFFLKGRSQLGTTDSKRQPEIRGRAEYLTMTW